MATCAAATLVFLTVSVERAAAQVASVSASGQQQIRETEKRVGATVDFKILNVIDIPSQLDEVLKPYLKRQVSLAETYEIAGKIVQKYHDDGYVFVKVTVPGQHVMRAI